MAEKNKAVFNNFKVPFERGLWIVKIKQTAGEGIGVIVTLRRVQDRRYNGI